MTDLVGQMEMRFQADARDEALEHLANHRSGIIAAAQATAIRIDMDRGRVTSTEVLAALRMAGLGDALDRVDRRFMGVIFRQGWIRLGWEPTGSHCRPVAVWTRKET